MNIVEEVKSRLDIVDVVSETVSLKKSGQSYTGFCPFHANTKTPSFVVFPHTQTWRCFGACAEGGDLISFVMKREGFDFKEALLALADRAGVHFEKSSPQSSEQEAQHRKLLELNAAAALYFHKLLLTSPAAATTRQYLTKRALNSETIATFQLGYALDQWDALKNHFLARGYTAEALIAAGLVTRREDGSTGYDRFRHRLMIPIRNIRGQVIGFGARALAEDQLPKYLNSPQTDLFDKSATLFGLDLARHHIRRQNQVVIVEGYMDVIQAYQQGAKNVVAQMGTALTEPQLKLVARGKTKIVLALDADTAGNAATIRSLSLARQALPKTTRPTTTARGIDFEAYTTQDIYIASLPANQDPDDVLRQGLEIWQQLLEQAVPALDFYETLILDRANIQTPQGKATVVHELIPIYREIQDDIEKAARVQQLARTIGIDERLLMAELKGSLPANANPKKPASPLFEKHLATTAGKIETGTIGLEEYCLALILNYPTSLALANDALEKQNLSGLTINDFNQGENKELFKSLQLWTASEIPKQETLRDMTDELLMPRLNFLFTQWQQRPPVPLGRINQSLKKTILRMRIKNINDQINNLQFLQRETTNKETSNQYKLLASEYVQQRKQLEHCQ